MLSNPISAAPSHENAPRRRKVRKGTRSCWECRQRKVKCTFASGKDSICITCHRRGSLCASQAIQEKPQHTGNNIGHGQKSTIRQPSEDQTNLPELSLLSTYFPVSPTPSSRLPSNSVNAGEFFEQARKLPTTSKLPPTPASSCDATAKSKTNSKIIQALINSLPPREDIELLLVRVNKTSMLRYQSYYTTRSSTTEGMLGVQFSLKGLSNSDTHPVLLARQLLLFAVALQYLPPNEEIPGLTRSHHQIMKDIAESAITTVTTNDSLLGTLEGLENIILEAKYHVNNGNIRRSWVTLRRSIMVAQLLNLHRPGHYRFTVIDDQNDSIPELMWANILTMERGQSLLLGLPTSTSDMDYEGQTLIDDIQKVPSLPVLTMEATAQILKRNQFHLSCKPNQSEQALAMTKDIDRDLIKITEHMPSTFWRPPMFLDLEKDSADAIVEAGRNSDLVYYYSLVNQLHLPYIFCRNDLPQSIYSRAACLNLSREILNREIAIHSFDLITARCRIGDFMALIAGMTVMLAHIVSYCQRGNDNMLVHQRMSDRAIVEQALNCMSAMSTLHEDGLNAKCAVLKGLLAVESDAAQGQSHRNVLIIQVPYKGSIRISPEGISTIIPFGLPQDKDSNENVTIGGIGSIHLNSSTESAIDVTSATSPSTTTNSTNFTANFQHATDDTQIWPDHFSQQQDYFPPDAAASLDDWVFQGIDTAFFDVLMRGVDVTGSQELSNPDTEVWNM